MFRYNDGQFKKTPPATVEYNGYNRNFFDLTREQWDEIGYNEAISVRREPFTSYETKWVKGDDLIYREEVVAATVDEAALLESQATTVRAERDRLLSDCDWTQLADSILDDEDRVLWQSYRQALRDLPQQEGFPVDSEFPVAPGNA